MTTRKNQKGGMLGVFSAIYSRYSQAVARTESNKFANTFEKEVIKLADEYVPPDVKNQLNRAATKALQKFDATMRNRQPEIAKDAEDEFKQTIGCDNPKISCPNTNTNSKGISYFGLPPLPNTLYRPSSKRRRPEPGVYSNKVQKEIGEMPSGTDDDIRHALETSNNPTLRNLNEDGIKDIIAIINLRNKTGGKRRRTIKKRKSKRRRTRRKH